jgi:bifunctional DNA-binding transcriptional regulator/antitoxin component of YhaV-PrlF toxin-antitoxin module
MKLQKSISRRLRDKEYSKFQVAIPNNFITQLSWEVGDNLEGKVTTKGLLICKTEQKQPQKKLDYDQFKDIVTHTLASLPQGCTWTELRLKAGLTQVTPSPIWVKMMEDEGILKRFQQPGMSRIIWKLSEERSVPDGPTLNQWLTPAEKTT